jgi:hypothetical protein
LEAFDPQTFPTSKFTKVYKELVRLNEMADKESKPFIRAGKRDGSIHRRDDGYEDSRNRRLHNADPEETEKKVGPKDEYLSYSQLNPDSRTVREYVCVDNNAAMLGAAKEMCQDSGVRSRYFNSISELVSTFSVKPGTHSKTLPDIASLNKNIFADSQRFELIMASYIFSELKDDPARKAVAQLLTEMLTVNGVLVIIENGNADGNHTTRTARQFILDAFNGKSNTSENAKTVASMQYALPLPAKAPTTVGAGTSNTEAYGTDDLGASIVAPCTHDMPCPIGSGKLCTFGQKVCL